MSDDELLAGRYRRTARIGRGGMGEVWLADDELLQRQVAVKRLNTGDGAPDPVALERMMREARLAARLDTPHAVTIHDVVLRDGHPHLIMQFVAGHTLDDRLADGPIGIAEAARIGGEVASALADAHALGIVHRDVKPANVLLDARGRALLADFGIARLSTDAKLTQTGAFIGTPTYLAPELARGEEASAASDVYALGATVYAAVEGHAPFEDAAGNTLALLARILTQPVPPPQHAGALTALVTAALAADPAHRPTAAQFASEAGGIAAGGGAPRTDAPPPADRRTLPDAPRNTPPPAHTPPPPTIVVTPRPAAPPPGQPWNEQPLPPDGPLDTLLSAIAHTDRITFGWSGPAEEWQDLMVEGLAPALRPGDRVDLFVPALFTVDPALRAGLPRRVTRSLAAVAPGAAIALEDRMVCAWVAGAREGAHLAFELDYRAVLELVPATYTEDGHDYVGFDTRCAGFVWPVLFNDDAIVAPLHHLLAARLLGTVRPVWTGDRLTGRTRWTPDLGWVGEPGWSDDD